MELGEADMEFDESDLIRDLRNPVVQAMNERYARIDQVAGRWVLITVFGWIPGVGILLLAAQAVFGPEDGIYGLFFVALIVTAWAAVAGYFGGRRSGFHEALVNADNAMEVALANFGDKRA